ncbi:MAG: HD-GYP domain-containing protein [Actinomycetota bacterium]
MRRTGVFASIAIAMIGVAAGFARYAGDVWLLDPGLLFGVVLVAASACTITAVALGWMAHRNDQAELGFVSVFYFAGSVLPLVHGLTVPGVLFDMNQATVNSVFWVVPVGLLGIGPTLIRNTEPGRWLGRHWRTWTLASYGLTLVIASALLAFQHVKLAPTMGSPLAWATATLAYGITLVAAWRHLHLARIANRDAPAVIAYGYLLVGASMLVFYGEAMWSRFFWLAHTIDIAGSFLAMIGGLIVYRRCRSLAAVLKPVTAIDPHSALELGLSDVVHEFVADLERKDELTRDHVVRVGALCIDVAVEFGCSPEEIRACGLAGLLHDVGKLRIADSILTKPGRLEPDEYIAMQRHTVIGADLVAATPALAPIADAVLAHHEHWDGNGYPDGRVGEETPLAARIVAVCDAYDAMTYTRHYRAGMSAEKVRGILLENAGTQWDPSAVHALLHVIDGRSERRPSFRHLRHDHAHPVPAAGEFGCDCVPRPAVAAHRTDTAA